MTKELEELVKGIRKADYYSYLPAKWRTQSAIPVEVADKARKEMIKDCVKAAESLLNTAIERARKETRKHAEMDMLVDVQIGLMQINQSAEEQRDNTLKFVNNRLATLKHRSEK